WLGLTVRGTQTIGSVLDGSPAQEAGLYADDELVALDGFRVDGNGVIARCEERRPGEMVRITVFRREQLVDVPVKLGTRPADAVYLARVDDATPEQKNAYRAWLGEVWLERGSNED